MNASAPTKIYPPKWEEFDRFAADKVPVNSVFTSAGDVNRFQARYSAARGFKGIQLHGYDERTELGYSGLFRVLLTWSSYEALRNAVRKSVHASSPKGCEMSDDGTIERIRALDREGRFFSFIMAHAESGKVKTSLKSYLSGGTCRVMDLCAAIRHVFVHGQLTPSSNKGEAKKAAYICSVVSEGTLSVVENEFAYYVGELSRHLELQRKEANAA